MKIRVRRVLFSFLLGLSARRLLRDGLGGAVQSRLKTHWPTGDLEKARENPSFTVGAGEIFGVAGPNGSGKSTLFNLIAGIPFGPDSGRVRFDGVEIQGRNGNQIARLGLARAFQRETSFDGLSVLENAVIGAHFGKPGQSLAAVREQAAETLEFVGIAVPSFGRLAGELSVYDRKCLMLATAIAMKPRMILLDEPASSLTRPAGLAGVFMGGYRFMSPSMGGDPLLKANFGPWRPMIIALLIIGVMLAYPSGLVGVFRAAWGQARRRVSRSPPGVEALRWLETTISSASFMKSSAAASGLAARPIAERPRAR